jgi:hypothetical protein
MYFHANGPSQTPLICGSPPPAAISHLACCHHCPWSPGRLLRRCLPTSIDRHSIPVVQIRIQWTFPVLGHLAAVRPTSASLCQCCAGCSPVILYTRSGSRPPCAAEGASRRLARSERPVDDENGTKEEGSEDATRRQMLPVPRQPWYNRGVEAAQ